MENSTETNHQKRNCTNSIQCIEVSSVVDDTQAKNCFELETIEHLTYKKNVN